MKARPFNTCLLCLCFLLYSSALPRAKDYRPMSSEYVPGEGNIGSEGVPKEPSCDELRAMWRFSKRQSRAKEITNEIPTYRDPFVYNVWEEYARPRSAGRVGRYRKPPVYGRVVHSAGHVRTTPDNSPERIRAFEEVARLFGTAVNPLSAVPRRKTSFRLGGGGAPFSHMPVHSSQSGSFQHLKELIRTERARELQEQRMSEEAERNVMKEMGKLQFGRVNEEPPPAMDNSRSQERPGGNRGVVAFPDILVPASKYMEDYMMPASQMTKYKQRLPDTNTIMGGVSQWAW